MTRIIVLNNKSADHSHERLRCGGTVRHIKVPRSSRLAIPRAKKISPRINKHCREHAWGLQSAQQHGILRCAAPIILPRCLLFGALPPHRIAMPAAAGSAVVAPYPSQQPPRLSQEPAIIL